MKKLKLKTVNVNTSKKAQSLAKKLLAERIKYQNNSEAIERILFNTDLIIGGHKMVQKLRKQKTLFDSLVKVLNDRIEIFNENTHIVDL